MKFLYLISYNKILKLLIKKILININYKKNYNIISYIINNLLIINIIKFFFYLLYFLYYYLLLTAFTIYIKYIFINNFFYILYFFLFYNYFIKPINIILNL